eukprot:1159628-Pelagomonas_calceolata.AAC.5
MRSINENAAENFAEEAAEEEGNGPDANRSSAPEPRKHISSASAGWAMALKSMKTRQSPAVRTSWPSGNHTSSDAVQRTAEQLELGIGPHTHADCSVLSFGLGAPRDLSKTFWNCLVSMAQENPQRESAGWNLLQLAAQDVSKDPVGFAATSPVHQPTFCLWTSVVPSSPIMNRQRRSHFNICACYRRKRLQNARICFAKSNKVVAAKVQSVAQMRMCFNPELINLGVWQLKFAHSLIKFDALFDRTFACRQEGWEGLHKHYNGLRGGWDHVGFGGISHPLFGTGSSNWQFKVREQFEKEPEASVAEQKQAQMRLCSITAEASMCSKHCKHKQILQSFMLVQEPEAPKAEEKQAKVSDGRNKVSTPARPSRYEAGLTDSFSAFLDKPTSSFAPPRKRCGKSPVQTSTFTNCAALPKQAHTNSATG